MIKSLIRTKLILFKLLMLILCVILWINTKSYSDPITFMKLDSIDLKQVNKVMIVAHPDDETIWGGAHLLNGGYFVVCLTNGDNPIRKDEFIKAVSASGNIPLILSYPDKIFGIRSNWIFQQNKIDNDLMNILSYKNWEEVVTHNPKGEYGHIQHKKTSALTYKAWQRACLHTPLFYFGTYYNKKELMKIYDSLTPIDNEVFEQKYNILNFYKSQEFIDQKFGHMYPYEMWVQQK